MKFFRTIALLAAVIFCFAACEGPEPEPDPVRVSVSPSSLAFSAEGGSQQLTVSSNGLWYVRTDGSWLTTSASSGSGNGTIQVTASNNAGNARTATVYLESADNKATVSVSQAGYVKPEPVKKTIREIRSLYKGSDYKIPDDFYIEGVVISDFRRETDGGLDNYTSAKTIVLSDGDAGLMLYCKEDNKKIARGQKIRVDLKDQTLSVYGNGAVQVNGLPLENITANGTETPVAKEITVEQLLTGEYESTYVAVKDVQVRLEYLELTFAADNENRSIAFEGRDGGSFDLFTSKYAVFRSETVPSGSGILKGIAGKYGARYQITISQKSDYAGLTGTRFGSQAHFYLETADKTVSGDAGTFDISLAATVKWSVSSSNAAFSVSPASGNGSGLVAVTYGDNPSTTESRTAVITFTTDDEAVSEKKISLTVVQQPYEALVESTVQAWLELPAIQKQEGRAFFSHDMTFNSYRVRNYSFLLDLDGRVSRWVAYPLYKGVDSGVSRTDKWEYDPLVPKRFQGAAYKSYTGYDRGHQVPSADRLCNVPANEQTFYFTNITPQNQSLNQGLWEDAEKWVRMQISGSDTVYVVSGCVLTTQADPTVNYIPDNYGNDVAVPKAYYKVMLKYKAGTANGGYSAIGLWMENKSYGSTAFSKNFLKTVDEIENLTGEDFFHNLKDEYEKEAESKFDASAWGL